MTNSVSAVTACCREAIRLAAARAGAYQNFTWVIALPTPVPRTATHGQHLPWSVHHIAGRHDPAGRLTSRVLHGRLTSARAAGALQAPLRDDRAAPDRAGHERGAGRGRQCRALQLLQRVLGGPAADRARAAA